MQVTITQLDAYAPPVLAGASAALPAIVANPGRFAAVTVSAQGLVTAGGTLLAGDITTALDFTPQDSAAMGAYALAAALPSRLGQLANDVGFITAGALAGLATADQVAAISVGLLAQVTTQDATPTLMPNLPQPPAGQSVQRLTWKITAQDTVGGDAAIWDAVLAIKRAAIGVPPVFLLAPSITLFAADASLVGAACAFSIVGSALDLVVTGLSGRSILWQAKALTGA